MKSFRPYVLLLFSFIIYICSYTQSLQWAHNKGSSGVDLGFFTIRDNNGDIISCGAFSGANVDFDPGPGVFNLSSSGDFDIFLTKISPTGQLIWAFKIGGTLRDEGYAIACDASNNIFFTGYFRGNNVDFDPGPGSALLTSNGDNGADPGWGGDIFIAKYNSAGQYLWAKNLGGTTLYDSGNAITVDQNGDVYFGGYFTEIVDFDAGPGVANLDWNTGRNFLVKYNSIGQFQWAFNFGQGGNVDNNVYGLKYGPSGHIYVTGFYQGTNIDFDPGPGTFLLSSNGSYEFYLAKYTTNGQFVWAVSAGGSGADVARGLFLDNNENIYVVGDYRSSSMDFDLSSSGGLITNNGSADIFFVKYNSSGQNQFAFGFGGSADDLGLAVGTDNSFVYIGGSFTGNNIDFDPSASSATLSSNGGSDIFYGKYLLNGQFQCAFNIGGTNNDYCRALTTTGLNKITAIGYFQSTNIDFDPGPGVYNLSSNGNFDIYQAEYEWTLVVAANSDTTICSGQSVQLNATGATTYSWSPANGLSNPNISNPIATPTVTTQYIVTGMIGSGCIARDTVVITVNPLPNVVTNADTSLCMGGQIQLNTSGANIYSWSPTTGLSNPNIANPIASPLSTTQYIVTGIDMNGCMAKDTVIITINPLPTVLTNNDTAICNGSQLQLNTTGANSYSWSPPTGLSNPNIPNPIAAPFVSTQYIVTGTDINGCSANDTILITINPSPTIISNNDTTFCPGGQVQLNTTGAISYSWSPPTGLSDPNIPNPIATPVVTTQYIVTGIASNGCVGKDTVVIIISPLPNVLTNSDTSICNGSQLQLNTTGASSYSWSPSSGLSNPNIANPIATPIITTQYIVTGIDMNGCVGKDSLIITVNPLPLVSANSDATICEGEQIQLNATGALNYSWSPPTGLSNPNISNPVASPILTTQYIVTGSNVNGCVAKDTIVITILPKPVITISNDTLICSNASVQLFASGGISYNWTPSATLNNSNIPNPVASPVANTTYYVIVANSNNCTNIDSVKVDIRLSNNFTINQSLNTCLNNSIQLNASGGDTYNWQPVSTLDNPNISNPFATPQTTTTYTVQITDTTCAISEVLSTTVNVLPLPTIQASKSNDIDCVNDASQLSANGATIYSWLPISSLNNPNIYNPIAKPLTTTQYTVTGTDAFGCTNTDTITIYIKGIGNGIYLMPNAFTPNNDRINDCFKLKYWGLILELDFSIYNRWGERIFHSTKPGECWDGTYNGHKQNPGVYVYLIKAKTACDDFIFKKGLITLIR